MTPSGAEPGDAAVLRSTTGVVVASRIVTGTAVHEPGWIAFEDGLITGVGEGPVPEAMGDALVRDWGKATLVPGFVDIHVHGGGGAGYTEGSAELARRARQAHLEHGTTTTMASLVTDTPDRLLEQVRVLAGLVEFGEIRGIHLEGPWLSPERAGAHDPSLLRTPDLAEIDALLAAGKLAGAGAGAGAGDGTNAIAMVTIAPELPGAIEAIERFVEAGVTVAIGHTDADYACVVRAIEAGATVATHLFNAMRPLHHREPGPVLALMEDPRVSLELIADGTHLHPSLARWAADQAGSDRALLVTDAMGAAACGDGSYRLGALDVDVAGGVARLAGTETIAGSTATMDGLFRGWVTADETAGGGPAEQPGRPGPSATWLSAVRMTSVNPARAMGWSDVGDLAVGRRMDAVAIDPELRVVGVMQAELRA